MDRYLSGGFIRLLVFDNVYLITDCRCVFNEITLDTDWFVYVASRFIVSGVQGGSLRVSAKWLFILRPRGVFEYFVSLFITIVESHHAPQISGVRVELRKSKAWRDETRVGGGALQKLYRVGLSLSSFNCHHSLKSICISK